MPFCRDRRVHVLRGDFAALWAHGPFHLLFADVKAAKSDRADEVIAATSPGGLIVLDDFTPLEEWPPARHGAPDPVRDRWFGDGRLHTVELRTSAHRSVLVSGRRTGASDGSDPTRRP